MYNFLDQIKQNKGFVFVSVLFGWY